jgi:putative ABC transport system substrate-binding protein
MPRLRKALEGCARAVAATLRCSVAAFPAIVPTLMLAMVAPSLLAQPAAQRSASTGAAEQSPRVSMVFAIDVALTRSLIGAFSGAMARQGQHAGATYHLDLRFAGDPAKMPALVLQVARENPAVVVTSGLTAARAVRDATTTVPVVLWTSGDLVDAGIVKSLSRPGGNITGVSDLADVAAAKRLELLHAALPQARRIALLLNPDFPGTARIESRVSAVARTNGIVVTTLHVRDRAALAKAVESLAGQRVDAVLPGGDPLFNNAPELFDRARALGIPVIHYWQGTAERGALLSYEVDLLENMRQAASHVHRILEGSHPGDLPVYQPTRFRLVVNQSVARVLGLTLPPEFLLRADQVIR